MPCLYAHYAFGREVRKNLPEEIRACIDKYPAAFDWGLQGPDFLFYYHMSGRKIIQGIGRKIHRKSLTKYLKKILPIIKEKGIESAETAYLLGFLCHYMLDSQCHPYINFWKEGGFSHADTEKVFDQYLIQKDGKNPGKEKLYQYLPLERSVFDSIVASYPWLQKRHLYISIFSYVAAKRLFYADCVLKREFLTVTAKILKLYRQVNRHYYWEELPERFERNNIRLYSLYREAIGQTVTLETYIWKVLLGEEEFSQTERLELDFGGLRIK